MRAGLFSVASVTLLQLVVARAALHQNHQHLHDKRAPAVVYQTVTDSAYEYYDAAEVIVYKDAQGNPLSTVTSWKGEKHSSTSVSSSQTPPPPPPPPASSSSAAAPPPQAPKVEEKVAQPVNNQPAQNTPAASSAPPAQASSSGSDPKGGNPKGVAFNTAAQFSQVSGISWACNWASSTDVSLGDVEYVPQIWGQKDGMESDFNKSVQGNSAVKHALFYNEPDMPFSDGGSQIDVGIAIGDFARIMQPLQSQNIKVSSPCVAANDIDYLRTFLHGIKGKVDILCFHWYGTDAGQMPTDISQFTDLAQSLGIPEVWINEWAVYTHNIDLSPFVQVMQAAKIDRYAYNMNDMIGQTGY